MTMSGPVRLLGDAVVDAQRANAELGVQMAVHEIWTWLELHHLVVWPAPVTTAYDRWMARMVEVVTIIGAAMGVDDVERAPQDVQSRLTERAYDLVFGTETTG